jgi:hypothetical protein
MSAAERQFVGRASLCMAAGAGRALRAAERQFVAGRGAAVCRGAAERQGVVAAGGGCPYIWPPGRGAQRLP